MGETTRLLPKILREIAAQDGMTFDSFSGDWVIELQKDGRVLCVMGYKFPNNDAAMAAVCDDKSALADVLAKNGLPCVPHYYFMRPDYTFFAGTEGQWGALTDLLHRYGALVCKPNAGTGGTNVFKAGNGRELEAAVTKIYSTSQALAVSPCLPVRSEYRCIVCEEEVPLIYRKLRPFVVGDGKHNVGELMAQNALLHVPNDEDLPLQHVPAAGERFEISWKHNLGRGASPQIVREESAAAPLAELALRAARRLGLRFVSVDIVDAGDGLQILEINSGVMMESFAAVSAENYATAKGIYRKALRAAFARRGAPRA